MDLIAATRKLVADLGALRPPVGVSRVYNPLAYMGAAHERYLARYAVKLGEAWEVKARPYLVLGMNPGPWGMVQTGIPFGDVVNAATILRLRTGGQMPAPDLSAPGSVVGAPAELASGLRLHPKRPVVGLACTRREASGERLWSGLAQVWGDHADLDAVLADAFAVNYCPLAYFAADPQGTNVTPEEFGKRTVKAGPNPCYDPDYVRDLDAVCSPYLAAVVKAFATRTILAVGRYAERKAQIAAALQPTVLRPKVVYLTHPSPLATHSAEEWAAMVRTNMTAAGVLPTAKGGAT